jgi:hypothetical protein
VRLLGSGSLQVCSAVLLSCRRVQVWNALGLVSNALMVALLAVWAARADDQAFRILVAAQLLVLYLRSVYFMRAIDQLGAMAAMLGKVSSSERALRCLARLC